MVSTTNELWTVNPSGSNIQLLYAQDPDGSHENPQSVDGSADGTRVAFVMNRKVKAAYEDIHVIGREGDGLLQVTDNSGGTGSGGDSSPRWTIDGRINFDASRRDPNNGRWIVNGDGTGLTFIAPYPRGIPSPDGLSIAYHENNLAGNGVMVADFDGSNPRRITPFGSFGDSVASMDWAPDGASLFVVASSDTFPGYEAGGNRSALFRIDVDSGAVERILLDAETLQFQDVAASPDGQAVAIAKRTTILVVPLANPAGVAQIPVSSFPGASQVSDLTWLVGADPDTLPPLVTGVPDRAPNGNGWYREPVTITWSALDPEPSSGSVTQPAPTLADTDGEQVPYTSEASCDAAGNCATGELAISLDQQAPDMLVYGPADGETIPAGADGTVTCSAADALSGLDGACSVQVEELAPDPDARVWRATATATDLAGNTTTQVRTFRWLIDADGPEITATADRPANAEGWYNAAIGFSFTCLDPSGVASCPSPLEFAQEGADQSAEVTATDNVGNSSSLLVSGVSIDLTPPTLVFEGNQGSYGLTDQVEISCSATDELSGIAAVECEGVSVRADQLPAGVSTLSGEATDRAGNHTSATVSFTVVVDTATIGDLIDSYLPEEVPGNAAFRMTLKRMLERENLTAFTNLVEALEGRRLTAEQADALLRYAAAL